MKTFFVYAVTGLLCFAACNSVSKTSDYPAAALDETPRENRERLFDKKENVPDGADEIAAETDETETVPEETKELAETFFPQAAPEDETPIPSLLPSLPEPEPPVIVESEPVPELSRLPEIPVEPEPPPPPPPEPPPPPPVARPAPRPVPPPIPEFIRPSEPFVPVEEAVEIPQITIPDLPARSYPLTGGEIKYSRTVSAFKGQYIEIPFRGPGWVYLGEQGSRRGVYYDSRRIDEEGMIFVFRADDEGTYSLKFDKQDFIRDSALNDYVQVIVTPPPEITGSAWNAVTVAPERVYAPRWPPPVPVAAAVVPATPITAPDTGAVPEPQQDGNGNPRQTANGAVPAGSLPGAYLAKAKEEYNAGRISGALEILDQFRMAYPQGNDEAYWLYGQALEANSPSRDIALSLAYYRRIIQEYPQSDRYEAARRRIAYLERYYFNIQ